MKTKANREEIAMELCRLRGEYEAVELAELAAGRIRRSVRGVQRTLVQPLGKAAQSLVGKEHYTLLPANIRMSNYLTAVMVSDFSDDVLPEPMYRRTAELLILCDKKTAGSAEAILHATGAMKVRKS